MNKPGPLLVTIGLILAILAGTFLLVDLMPLLKEIGSISQSGDEAKAREVSEQLLKELKGNTTLWVYFLGMAMGSVGWLLGRQVFDGDRTMVVRNLAIWAGFLCFAVISLSMASGILPLIIIGGLLGLTLFGLLIAWFIMQAKDLSSPLARTLFFIGMGLIFILFLSGMATQGEPNPYLVLATNGALLTAFALSAQAWNLFDWELRLRHLWLIAQFAVAILQIAQVYEVTLAGNILVLIVQATWFFYIVWVPPVPPKRSFSEAYES